MCLVSYVSLVGCRPGTSVPQNMAEGEVLGTPLPRSETAGDYGAVTRSPAFRTSACASLLQLCELRHGLEPLFASTPLNYKMWMEIVLVLGFVMPGQINISKTHRRVPSTG